MSDLGLVLGGVLTSCKYLPFRPHANWTDTDRLLECDKGLFALRMYALYGQNIVVLLGLGMLIAVKLILDIVRFTYILFDFSLTLLFCREAGHICGANEQEIQQFPSHRPTGHNGVYSGLHG